ncbi:Hypothetical protein ETEE_0055 [Edwardsiella anguillarum ET080813]|uniref:Uncharacterized protein n=1 Tax=Edwardsiella anguillarum ET080813 TaxID=667120 RepID=A0A076LED8_9GAMM|nr:Hypothetical protein ETEE_0055 [Edwardsiella anguillarum ET080813]
MHGSLSCNAQSDWQVYVCEQVITMVISTPAAAETRAAHA